MRRDILIRFMFLLMILAAGTARAKNAAGAGEPSVKYRTHILPLLSDRCFKCHGPDSASRQAGLRLDRPDDALVELESGSRAIVPGKPAESALVGRIESDDRDFAMPPPDSGITLAADEIALIRRWIEEGAVYEPHWAFVAPVRPHVPTVRHEESVRNPIDAFVFAQLETEGIEPAPRARAERLTRRVHFDLIGLPPTLAEIDEFIADDSPPAYEQLVDRLLKSSQYGERMAADWLDGAHYADSNGYQNDFARFMWPWRDWVIQAFNANMPYDQFVINQLAGDLLPNPTQSQRVATGFCRNHRTVTEAGSIDDEWLVENVVDRTETTGTMFLGLTVGCARCHDHKFDPITQREFYQLFAFFNNVAEKGVYEETRGNVAPLVKVATSEQQQELSNFDHKIAELTRRLSEQMSRIAPARPNWIASLASTVFRPEPEAVLSIRLQQDTIARVAVIEWDVRADETSITPTWKLGLFGDAAVFTGKEHLEYSKVEFPLADRPFSCAVWVKPEGDGAILSKMNDDLANRGCDLLLFEDGKLGIHLIHSWPENAIKAVTKQRLNRDKWSHLAVSYDGSGKAAGVKMYFDGKIQDIDVEVDQLTKSFANDQPFRVGQRSKSYSLHAGICDVRLFNHALSAGEVESVLRGSLHRVLVSTDFEQLEQSSQKQFDDLMLAYWDDPMVADAANLSHELKKNSDERTKFDEAIPTSMVMEELAEPRATYVLDRGSYDRPIKSERLTPNVPSVLPPLPADAPRNRLGLARWIASPQNPLTARVEVNRLWQQFFGLGLVKTSDNFGFQAETPSHPELLDWLATELIASNWNVQHIQRLIVTSYVYQQSADVEPLAYQRDPENRLLARGPRGRLPAESLRDNALAISGLLAPKIGGPSVMPYQPAGLWEELAGGAHEDYVQAHGDDLYRRSLYVYRKRTVPHPSMSTFDAPSWEFCQVKRARTNTPQQALALLNDMTYVEAARKLAERILLEGGDTPGSRLTFAFRIATGRSPSQQELATLNAGLERHLARFRAEPNAAEQLVSQGESPRDKELDVVDLAAHTTMVSVLLNLDESMSKN